MADIIAYLIIDSHVYSAASTQFEFSILAALNSLTGRVIID